LTRWWSKLVAVPPDQHLIVQRLGRLRVGQTRTRQRRILSKRSRIGMASRAREHLPPKNSSGNRATTTPLPAKPCS
jgi:hypothetical protein